MLDQIREATRFLQKKGFDTPQIGIILGTGLGKGFVSELEVILEVPYADIPHFPVATVEFHQGKLVYGTLAGVPLVAMHGRFHYYEGYSLQQVTFPVRVMKELGVQNLLISNAAGNLNPDWKKGELMLLDDHIDLLPDNPLRGKNIDEQGPRFPDMSQPYDRTMNERLRTLAVKNNIVLREGVYVVASGPNLETRAEYRYMRNLGADAVGMSTVPEVIVANHVGMPCVAISVLTDDCDPDNLAPANIEEIIAIAGAAEKQLTTLFVGLVKCSHC